MKRLLNFTVLSLILTGCIKDKTTVNDLLSPLSFSTKEILADGTTIVTITSTVNANSDSSRRLVIFTASSGSFVGGKGNTISQKAVFVNQELVATVQFKAPMKSGMVKINAKMNLSYQNMDFSQTDSIKTDPSYPASIKISSSAFGVQVNFGNEVTITGILSNISGKPVSLGNKVEFEDTYEDGTPVNGRFRQLQISSDTASSVSAIYSPGFIPIGKNLKISCYVLDANGNKTSISNLIIITSISN